MKNDEKQVLLDVKNLKKYFNVGNKKILKAVDDISLQIYKGETLGLVGESGCGKSTFGRTVIHLYDPTDGTVTFDGTKIDKNLDTKQRHELCRRMQMIFQDPYASLDPHQKVYQIVSEGMRIHQLTDSKEEEKRKVMELMEMVGLNAEHATRNVHEFSGGQRQRIGIARALIVEPQLVIADEPVSALDVSVQAQVINLLNKLKQEMGLTILFIAHNLSVVKYFSDRIGVMYFGKLVEMADSNITKNTLAVSMKKLMEKKPFSKISVGDICEDCGMNRKSFYYHFRDAGLRFREWCLRHGRGSGQLRPGRYRYQDRLDLRSSGLRQLACNRCFRLWSDRKGERGWHLRCSVSLRRRAV